MTNTQNKITKISFLLVEEFSMIAFASALEPLRTANRISKKKLFEWEFLSLNNQKVFCSNGISIDTKNLNEEKQFIGYGNSIIIQGGFLLIYDWIGYIMHRRHAKKQLNPLLQKIELSSSGIGFILHL